MKNPVKFTYVEKVIRYSSPPPIRYKVNTYYLKNAFAVTVWL